MTFENIKENLFFAFISLVFIWIVVILIALFALGIHLLYQGNLFWGSFLLSLAVFAFFFCAGTVLDWKNEEI